MRARCKQSGATLVEMVVSIVIMSISVTAVMMVVTQVGRHSADPMRRIQAAAIAESYMEEILAQALIDPDAVETGGAETGEVRATFDDVLDYHGLSDASGARDQTGGLISGLEGYNVSVSVTAVTLGGYPARRVDVSVGIDADAAFRVPLTGYRLN
ncbi:MAG: prepilin-type N-terminal cleavage/methylation domain-containing protein [Gammaproteobacteria bacterium]|nr:prepilin-type N-terminal cleavage/methylation domain-containing protein [Gammaproteobacteria bacterium]